MMHIKLKQVHLYKKQLYYFFIYIVFLKPAIIDEIWILDNLFNVIRFGLSLFFLIEVCIEERKFKTNHLLVAILSISALSTLFHGGHLALALSHYVPTLGVLSFVELKKDHLNEIIRSFYILGTILLVLNIVTWVLHPNGFNFAHNVNIPTWLLGQKQSLVACAAPNVLFGLLSQETGKKRKVKSYYPFILPIISCVLMQPVGLAICLVYFWGLVYIYNNKKTITVLMLRLLVLINIGSTLVTALLAVYYEKMNWLISLLAGINTAGVSKNVNIMHRITMWRYSMELIKRHPVFGVGQYISLGSKDISLSLNNQFALMHNLFLDIAVAGGISCLLLFVVWLYDLYKQLRNKWYNSEIKYCGFYTSAILVLFLTECPYWPMVFLGMVLPIWIGNEVKVNKNGEI